MSVRASRAIVYALVGLLEGCNNMCRFAYHNNTPGVPGANAWGSVDMGCKNSCHLTSAQSPINIQPLQRQNVPKSNFSRNDDIDVNWSDNMPNGSCKSTGDLLSQQYDCGSCKMTISARTHTQPMCTTYTLLQLHMHTGSEHTINGKRYDGEVHFVHGNNAGKGTTEFLVVGLFLEIAATEQEVHPFATKLFGENGTVLENNKHVLTPEDLLLLTREPSDPFNGEFYHYKGGFTNPPCTEIVQWFVLATPLKVRRNTIELYNEKNKAAGGKFDAQKYKSARPTQNANNKNTVFQGTTGANVAAEGGKCDKQLSSTLLLRALCGTIDERAPRSREAAVSTLSSLLLHALCGIVDERAPRPSEAATPTLSSLLLDALCGIVDKRAPQSSEATTSTLSYAILAVLLAYIA